MRKFRRSVGEIRQHLLAFFLLFPLATGDQSNLYPLGTLSYEGIIPSSSMKGYLCLLLIYLLLYFPCLEALPSLI